MSPTYTHNYKRIRIDKNIFFSIICRGLFRGILLLFSFFFFAGTIGGEGRGGRSTLRWARPQPPAPPPGRAGRAAAAERPPGAPWGSAGAGRSPIQAEHPSRSVKYLKRPRTKHKRVGGWGDRQSHASERGLRAGRRALCGGRGLAPCGPGRRLRGALVESAAASPRSARPTRGSGYCASRWGRSAAGKVFRLGSAGTRGSSCGKSARSRPGSRGG